MREKYEASSHYMFHFLRSHLLATCRGGDPRGGSAAKPLFFNLPIICRDGGGERVHASPLACSRLFYVFLVEIARFPFLLFELRVRVALYGVLAAVIEAAVFREKAFLVCRQRE